MRSIINISLPKETVKFVNAEIKKHHFASKSEFFRHLLREWMTNKLLEDIKEGEREYREGKTKKLDLKKLWK